MIRIKRLKNIIYNLQGDMWMCTYIETIERVLTHIIIIIYYNVMNNVIYVLLQLQAIVDQ